MVVMKASVRSGRRVFKVFGVLFRLFLLNNISLDFLGFILLVSLHTITTLFAHTLFFACCIDYIV